MLQHDLFVFPAVVAFHESLHFRNLIRLVRPKIKGALDVSLVPVSATGDRVQMGCAACPCILLRPVRGKKKNQFQ